MAVPHPGTHWCCPLARCLSCSSAINDVAVGLRLGDVVVCTADVVGLSVATARGSPAMRGERRQLDLKSLNEHRFVGEDGPRSSARRDGPDLDSST